MENHYFVCGGIGSMSEQQRRRSVIDDGLIRERKTSSRYVALKRVGLALARKQYTYPIPAAFSRCCPFSVTARDDSKMPQRRRCSQEIIIKTQFFKPIAAILHNLLNKSNSFVPYPVHINASLFSALSPAYRWLPPQDATLKAFSSCISAV